MDPARLSFRADVQGMRGVAVLLVVLNHVGLLRSGFVGVDIFFVISGFVVVRSLLHALNRPGHSVSTTLLDFYKRRVARLLPAFAVIVGLMALAAGALGPVRALQTSTGTALWGLLLASNVYLYRADGGYFDFASQDNAFLHLWSLSVEEQFYLIVPPLLALCFWKLPARRALVWAGAIAVGLSAFSLWSSLDFTYGMGPLSPLVTANDVFAFYSPITRAWEFGIGAILALAEHRWIRDSHSAMWRAFGFGLLILGIIAITESSPFPGWIAALPVFGTAALILARSSAVLEVRPLVWLGDLSYSWYLWHWPVIVFARAWFPDTWAVQPIAGAFSLLPAWLSYRWIEGGLRIRSDDPGPRATQKFRTSLALGGLALLVAVGANHWVTSPSHPATRWAQQTRLHADVESGCDASVTPLPGGECTWGDREAGVRPVFLIGDSQAGQFSEAFIEASERSGRPLSIRTASGCPTVIPLEQEVAVGKPCAAAVRSILQRVAEAPPSSVFLARSFRAQSQDATQGTADTARLDELVNQLEEWGHTVVLIAPVPTFDTWTVGACPALHEWMDAESPCAFDQPIADLSPAWQAERAFVQGRLGSTPSLRVADFIDGLCPGGRCPSHRDGAPVWRDQTHLSTSGSQQLTDAVEIWLVEVSP